MAGSAPTLTDLVAICHTAFGRRPLAQTLELVATATLELAEAERVAILLVSLDQVATVKVDRWLGANWDWDLGREEVDRLMSVFDDRPVGANVGCAALPAEEAVYTPTFGSPVADPVAFRFGTPGEEHGVLVVTKDTIDEDLACQMEVIAAQIHLATRTVRLAEAHQDQMVGLARMVVGLRQKSQEHVAELRALQEALEGESIASAEQIVARNRDATVPDIAAVASPIVAGLLLGELSVARKKSIKLTLNARNTFERVPAAVGELGFASIISNLLSNAFDAVEGLPAARRRVSLLLTQRDGKTVLEVRDWGKGLGSHAVKDLLRSGYSSKNPDRGTGLSLVNRLVLVAEGNVELHRLRIGTRVRVTLPDG